MNLNSIITITGNLEDRISLINNTNKRLLKVYKSIQSQQSKEIRSLSVDTFNVKDFDFTEQEYLAASKRVFKEVESSVYPLNALIRNENFSYKDTVKENFWGETVPFKNDNIFTAFVKGVVEFLVPYNSFDIYCETPYSGVVEIYIEQKKYEEEIRNKILTEIFERKITKIFINILSSFFKKRRLITFQSPLQIITYKYFDLVFSLKKEFVLKNRFIIDFFTTLFYLITNEEKYFRNIPVACRT